MEKTFRYLSMAALTVVAGFLTTACSNDDDNMEPSQAPHHVVTSKVTVNMADTDDATRALNADWTKTFVVGDKISVRYKNTADKFVRAVSEALTAADIQNGGKSASFTVTLTDPQENIGCRVIYPAERAGGDGFVDYACFQAQDGTFASLANNVEYAQYNGNLDGYNLPGSMVLSPQMSIFVLKFKDSATGDDITDQITELTVSNNANTSIATITSPQSPIYVAVNFESCDDLFFTVKVGSDTYIKNIWSFIYHPNGKVYRYNVTVVKQ